VSLSQTPNEGRKVLVWLSVPETVRTPNLVTPQIRTIEDPDQTKYTDYTHAKWNASGVTPLRFRDGNSDFKPTIPELIDYWQEPLRDWNYQGIAIDDIDPDDTPVFSALSGFVKPNHGGDTVAIWHSSELTLEATNTYSYMGSNVDYIFLERYYDEINNTAINRIQRDITNATSGGFLDKLVIVVASQHNENWITTGPDLRCQIETLKARIPEIQNIGIFGGTNVASGAFQPVIDLWDHVIQEYYPTMITISGLVGREDWENYTPNADLNGQNNWRVYNEAGIRPGSYDSPVTANQGGTSGMVVLRYQPTNDADNRVANLVLESGLLLSDHDKIAVRADLSQSYGDADHNGHIALMLRPSGETDATYHGYALKWRRLSGEADELHLERWVGGNVVTESQFFLAGDVEPLSVLVEDTGSNIAVWANASGMWERVHDVDTTFYNDHAYSGMIQMKTEGATRSAMIGNYDLHGVDYFDHQVVTSISSPRQIAGRAGHLRTSLERGKHLRID